VFLEKCSGALGSTAITAAPVYNSLVTKIQINGLWPGLVDFTLSRRFVAQTKKPLLILLIFRGGILKINRKISPPCSPGHNQAPGVSVTKHAQHGKLL